MALLFSLREFGSTFATRGRGAELRELVVDRLSDGHAVVIDFMDVTHVSYSFADEFVGKLSTAEPERIGVELRNMADGVERTVRSARQRRSGAVTC